MRKVILIDLELVWGSQQNITENPNGYATWKKSYKDSKVLRWKYTSIHRVIFKKVPNRKTLGHDHHHVMPLARISLTPSHHFSLSFIASGRSSGLHPISSHSCWMYVQAGRPAFAQPYVGVHRSTSLMSSSLLLQQSCMSGSSNLDSFHDGRQVAV